MPEPVTWIVETKNLTKIFGNGDKVLENEREESITFALRKSNIHCMTLGMESIAHVDDAVDRVMRIVKS